jgi:hypothetical protein
MGAPRSPQRAWNENGGRSPTIAFCPARWPEENNSIRKSWTNENKTI